MTLVHTSSPQEVIRNISSSLPPYPHCFVQDAQTSLVEQIPRRRVPVIKKKPILQKHVAQGNKTHIFRVVETFVEIEKCALPLFFFGFFYKTI